MKIRFILLMIALRLTCTPVLTLVEGQEPPDCWHSDCNQNGVYDIDDVFAQLSYIFAGGLPCPACQGFFVGKDYVVVDTVYDRYYYDLRGDSLYDVLEQLIHQDSIYIKSPTSIERRSQHIRRIISRRYIARVNYTNGDTTQPFRDTIP